MAMQQPAQDPASVQHGPLAGSIVALAGMPDDVSIIDDQLVLITRLAADRVAAVDYASVTATREGAHTTVAASSELALAVDEAQYADEAGCQRSRNSPPVAVCRSRNSPPGSLT
jgi:hypothetical protein